MDNILSHWYCWKIYLMESLRLENTTKTPQSNHQPIPPCPLTTSLSSSPQFLNTSKDRDRRHRHFVLLSSLGSPDVWWRALGHVLCCCVEQLFCKYFSNSVMTQVLPSPTSQIAEQFCTGLRNLSGSLRDVNEIGQCSSNANQSWR